MLICTTVSLTRQQSEKGRIMKYITIEREYGSGGTKIAKMASSMSGIPCYGQEILDAAAMKLNMPADEIRSCEEKASGSVMYSLYMLSQVQKASGSMLSADGQVFVEEQSAIRSFAKKGSGIFLGHCSGEALKDFDNVIKVYIYCDQETKTERIKLDYGISDDKIAAIERKNNKRRANYYEMNTRQKWDNLRGYDVVLDSGRLGIEACADIIAAIAR